MVDALMAVPQIADNQAKVLVTIGGETGDLPDPVSNNATDAEVRSYVQETVRAGGIPGIRRGDVDLTNYVVDRYPPSETKPYSVISLRPKTEYGA